MRTRRGANVETESGDAIMKKQTKAAKEKEKVTSTNKNLNSKSKSTDNVSKEDEPPKTRSAGRKGTKADSPKDAAKPEASTPAPTVRQGRSKAKVEKLESEQKPAVKTRARNVEPAAVKVESETADLVEETRSTRSRKAPAKSSDAPVSQDQPKRSTRSTAPTSPKKPALKTKAPKKVAPKKEAQETEAAPKRTRGIKKQNEIFTEQVTETVPESKSPNLQATQELGEEASQMSTQPVVQEPTQETSQGLSQDEVKTEISTIKQTKRGRKVTTEKEADAPPSKQASRPARSCKRAAAVSHSEAASEEETDQQSESKTKRARKMVSKAKLPPKTMSKQKLDTKAKQSKSRKVVSKEMETDQLDHQEVDEADKVHRLSPVPEVGESQESEPLEEDKSKIEVDDQLNKEILPTVVDLMESLREQVESTLESEKIERDNSASNTNVSLDTNFPQNSISDLPDGKIKNGEIEEIRFDESKLNESTLILDASLADSQHSHKRKFEVNETDEILHEPIKKAKMEILSQPELPQKGGSLMSFGEDYAGELGLGTIGLLKKRPTFIEGIDDEIAAIAVGAMHNIVLTCKGQVYSFGCNDELALGRDTSTSTPSEPLEAKPLKVPLPFTCTKISCGDSHSVALTSFGDVYVWGNFKDSNGMIGLVHDNDGAHLIPIRVQIDVPIVDIASGNDHILLLTNNGSVFSMGIAEQGQLGRISEEDLKFDKDKKEIFLKPQMVTPKDEDVVFDRIWAKTYCSFARNAKGDIYAWGLNNYCQLGFYGGKDVLVVTTPTKVEGLSNIDGKIEQISSGLHHSLARDNKGRVWTFGRHEYGRLGHGVMKDDQRTPKFVEALKDEKIIDICSGSCCSFAVSEKGDIFSWGMEATQLGLGDEDVYVPTKMTSKSLENVKVTNVGVGSVHTLLLAQKNGKNMMVGL